MVSRASAGCLAAMDQLNPRVLVPGEQPWSGVHLKVRWSRLIGIACNPFYGYCEYVLFSHSLTTGLHSCTCGYRMPAVNCSHCVNYMAQQAPEPISWKCRSRWWGASSCYSRPGAVISATPPRSTLFTTTGLSHPGSWSTPRELWGAGSLPKCLWYTSAFVAHRYA